MVVDDVRVRFFRYQPLQPVAISIGQQRVRLLCLVEVRSSTGHVGVGESWVNFPSWVAAERYATLTEGFAPALRGQAVTDVVSVHERLVQAVAAIGRQAGTTGPLSQALSGVDLALWDLLGSWRGLPVYKMLGGHVRRVPVYASGLGPAVDATIVRQQMAQGIRMFKLKVGFDDQQDYDNVVHLRDVVGPAADIMVDANQAWSVPQAQRMIQRLQGVGLRWVEEPIACDDVEGMEQLVAWSPVAISAGENLYGPGPFARWAARRALDIAQPDVTKVGGLTTAWHIAQHMTTIPLPYAPHFMGGIVGLMASCHLWTMVPGGIAVELDSNPNPLRTDVADPPLQIEDGCLVMSEAPGWGISLAEERLHPYEVSWQDAIRTPAGHNPGAEPTS